MTQPTHLGAWTHTRIEKLTCTAHSSALHEQILPDNVTIKKLQRDIYLNTEGEYMKESNTLADNATIKQLQREI